MRCRACGLLLPGRRNMRYLHTRRGTSRYRNGKGIDVAVIVWPRRQHSTEPRELVVPLAAHLPVAYRDGPAARSVAAPRVAVSARPGHHGGALNHTAPLTAPALSRTPHHSHREPPSPHPPRARFHECDVLLKRVIRTSHSLKLGAQWRLGQRLELGAQWRLGQRLELGAQWRLGQRLELGAQWRLGQRLELGAQWRLGQRLELGAQWRLGQRPRWARCGPPVRLSAWRTAIRR
jgi:hypothetical protein